MSTVSETTTEPLARADEVAEQLVALARTLPSVRAVYRSETPIQTRLLVAFEEPLVEDEDRLSDFIAETFTDEDFYKIDLRETLLRRPEEALNLKGYGEVIYCAPCGKEQRP